MQKRFFTTAMAAALALNLAACGGGDSLGPQIQLTDAQTEDLMEALDAIGYDTDLGFSVAAASVRSLVRSPDIALAVQPIDETDECPNGGTSRAVGNLNVSNDFSGGSVNVTQTFSNCRSESSSGTLWTINGAPDVKTAMNFTMNLSTYAFTMSGSQNGALNVSSSMGSGSCSINLNYSFTGSETSENGTITGTICGKPVSITINETY